MTGANSSSSIISLGKMSRAQNICRPFSRCEERVFCFQKQIATETQSAQGEEIKFSVTSVPVWQK
jgi:hypothetical protein